MLLAMCFCLYAFLHSQQVLHMKMVEVASALDLSAVDRAIWRSPNTPLAVAFGLATKANGILFLVVMGFRERWYLPILLYGVSLLTNLFLVPLQLQLGVARLSVAGFFAIPLCGLAAWALLLAGR